MSFTKLNHIEVFIVVCIITIVGTYGYYDSKANLYAHRIRGYSSIHETCMKNIKILQSAIEMYDIDNSNMITTYNEDIANILIEKKYLKDFRLPRKECKYLNCGDLTQDGFLYCEFHGDMENKLEIWNSKKADMETSKNNSDNPLLCFLIIFISVYPITYLFAYISNIAEDFIKSIFS